MNRIIKFRIWDKRLKKFLEGCELDDICLSYDGDVLILEGRELNLLAECEIQQFTGLSDKNGKEIYEGDIINCIGQGILFSDELIGEVEFQDFEYVIVTNDNKWPVASFKVLADKQIIGNIFENPELIKNENS